MFSTFILVHHDFSSSRISCYTWHNCACPIAISQLSNFIFQFFTFVYWSYFTWTHAGTLFTGRGFIVLKKHVRSIFFIAVHVDYTLSIERFSSLRASSLRAIVIVIFKLIKVLQILSLIFATCSDPNTIWWQTIGISLLMFPVSLSLRSFLHSNLLFYPRMTMICQSRWIHQTLHTSCLSFQKISLFKSIIDNGSLGKVIYQESCGTLTGHTTRCWGGWILLQI